MPIATTRRLLQLGLLALLFCGAGVAGWGQSRIPADINNYLAVTLETGSGDDDKFMVTFFEVPDTYTQPIYFGIYDPGVSADAYPNGMTAACNWDFHLQGGAGTLSATAGQALSFANLAAAQAGSTNLQTRSFTNQTGWVYFNPVMPSEGEHIGNSYYFKVIAEAVSGTAGTNKNGFQLIASTAGNDGQSPSEITQVRAFAYAWTLLVGTRGGTYVWKTYPFVPSGTAGNIYFWSFDGDASGGTPMSLAAYNKTNASTMGVATESGNPVLAGNDANSNPAAVGNFYSVTGETGGTWGLKITEGTTGNNRDAIVFWNQNSNVAGTSVLRTYASYWAPAQHHAVVSLPTGPVLAGSTINGSIQVVDVNNLAVPGIAQVRLTATGGSSPGINGASTDITLTTDANGYAGFTLTGANNAVPVTVTPYTDGSGAPASSNFSAITSGADTVVFLTDPVPVLTQATNYSYLSNAVGPLSIPQLTISDSGLFNISAGQDIQLRFSNGSASFLTSVGGPSLVVGGAGAGAVDNVLPYVTYASGICTIDVTSDFAVTNTLTINGLQIDPSSDSPGTVYLEVSVDNGSSWITASRAIVIGDPNQTYVWTGLGTPNSWNDPLNWSPNTGVPDTATENATIAVAGNYPNLPAGLSLNNLQVNSGASISMGANSLNVNGTLKVNGTITGTAAIILPGGNMGASYSSGGANLVFNNPILLVADTTIDSGGGSITFNAGATINGPHALTVSSGTGNISFSSPIGASTALTAITVNGTGTATLSSAGGWIVTGNTTIFWLPVTIAASQTLTDVGQIIFNSSLTLSAGVTLTLQALDVDFNGSVSAGAGRSLIIQPQAAGAQTFKLGGTDSATEMILDSGDLTALQTATFDALTLGRAVDTVSTNGTTTLGGSAITTVTIPGDLHVVSPHVLTMDSNISVTGALTIDSGATLNVAGNDMSETGTFSNSGTIQLTGITGQSISLANTDVDSGTWEYTATSGTVAIRDFGAAGTDYFNLTINGAGGTFTPPAALTVAGSLVHSAGTFSSGTGTVTMIGTGNLTGFNGTSALRNLVINASGNTVTLGSNILIAGDGAGIGGDLTLTAGTLKASTYIITLDGDWTNNVGTGGFTYDTGTVEFRNTNVDYTHAIAGSGNTTFYSLSCLSPAPTNTATSLTVTAGRTIAIASGGVLNLQGYSASSRLSLVSSHVNNDFFLDLAVGTGHSLSNVTVANSDLTGVAFSPVLSAPTVLGYRNDDLVTAPFWALTPPVATWVGGTASFLNDWATATNWSYGVVPDGSTDVVIADVVNQPILDGNRAVNDLTVNSGADLDVLAYTLTINGTLSLADSTSIIYRQGGSSVTKSDADSGTTIFRGATGSLEADKATDYFNLELQGAYTYTASAALSVAGTLTISNSPSVLDLASQDISLTGALANNGTIALTGLQTTISLSQDTDSGTWLYNGTSGSPAVKDFGASTDYYNLTVNGSASAFSLGADLVVANTLTVSGSTITSSANRAIQAGGFALTSAATYAIDANGVTLSLAAPSNTSIGLGSGAGTVQLSNAALGKVRAGGLTVQASGTGAMTVDGVNTTGASHGTLTLTGAAGMAFSGSASTFVSGLSAITTDSSANALTVSVDLTATAGGISLSGGDGNLRFTGNRALQADAGTITIQASSTGIVSCGGNLSLQALYINQPAETISMAANTLSLRSAEIDFAATSSVTGTGTVTIDTLTAAQNIQFNGSGTAASLELSPTDIAAIDTAHTLVTIGRTDGTGTISVLGSPSLPWALTIEGDNATADLIDVGTPLTLSDSGDALTFNAPARLSGNLQTNGGAVNFSQAVRVNAAPVLIDTDVTGGAINAGAVSFGGSATINAVTASSHGLTIDTTADGGAASAGATFGAAIGSVNPLSSLSYLGTSIVLPAINAVTLDVISYGTIDDSGTMTISGATRFETRAAAAAGTILLDQGGGTPVHNFGALTLQTQNAANSATVANAITLHEAGTIDLSGILTNGTCTLVSGTNIADSNTLDLTSGSLVLTAAGTITLDDNGAPFSNVIPTLMASAGGNIYIRSTGALVLGGASGVTTTAGTIDISVPGNITTGNSISTSSSGTNITLTSTAGSISLSNALTAAGAGAIDLNAGTTFSLSDGISVSSTSGNITIDSIGATNDLAINGSVITAGTGAITLTAGRSILMDASSLVQTANGAIILDADANSGGSLVLDVVESTASAQVTLRAFADGTITEADDTANIATSGLLFINDATQGSIVGSSGTGALNTAVAQLRARAAGAIYINQTGALQLGVAAGGVTTSSGLISIAADGDVTMGNTVTTTTLSGGAITIAATGTSHSLTISQNIQAANNATITLGATGSILRPSAGVLGSANSTSIISLTAGSAGAVGASGASIQMDGGTLWASAGSGGIYVNDAQSGLLLGDATGSIATTNNGPIAVSTTAGAISTGRAISTDGGVDLNSGSGGITLAHSITTTADLIRLRDAVTVAGALSLTSANGDITFDSTIASDSAARTLFLSAGAGVVTLTGQIGTNDADGTNDLATFTVSTADTVLLNSNVFTNGSQSFSSTNGTELHGTVYQALVDSGLNESITFSGPLVLFASPTIQTPGGNLGDNITFAAIDDQSGGTHSLTADAGANGTVTFGGAIGANVGLDDPAGITVASAATTTFSAAASIDGNVSLTTDDLVVSSNLTPVGSRTLIIEPLSATRNISIGTSPGTTLGIDATEMGYLDNGWSMITIGKATTGSGDITVSAASVSDDPLTLLSPAAGGSIVINNTLTGTGNASLTFNCSSGVGDGITLGANVTTAGGIISFQDFVTVTTAAVTVDSTTGGTVVAGAAITFTGPVDDDATPSTLTLRRGGSNTVPLTIAQAIGGSTPFSSVILWADDLALSAAISSATITLRTVDGTQPMNFGGPTGGFDVSLAEFQYLRYTGTTTATTGLIVGISGTQSGLVTVQSVTPVAVPAVQQAAITINSNSGTGQISLVNNLADALATGGSGPMLLRAGTGGITTSTGANSLAELSTTGIITLTSAGAIGASGNRIQFPAGQDEVDVTNGPGGVYLGGLGALYLGSASGGITTGGGSLDVITAAGAFDLWIRGPLALGTGGAHVLNPSGRIVLDYASGDIVTCTNGSIDLNSPVALNADASFNLVENDAANHLLRFYSTIDNINATARSLAVNPLITTERWDIRVDAAIGTLAGGSLSALSLYGNEIILGSIGQAAPLRYGVTGGTTMVASTVIDPGTITFNGALYETDGNQSYTAPLGSSFLMNLASPMSFITVADAVSFVTGTVQLANGSNLTVNTSGGAISLPAGVRGNSSETLTLNAGSGVSTFETIDVGQIGSGTEINTVILSAQDGISLRGDITTDDSPGNTVSITGPVTLLNSLTIDASGALPLAAGRNDITFTGTASTINGTATNLQLNATGITTLGGAVGGTSTFGTLTTDAAGSTRLNASVTTNNAQVRFNDLVVLGANAVITTAGGAVVFASTLDADSSAGNRTLGVAASAGAVTFSGVVGTNAGSGTLPASLTISSAGVTNLNSVFTSGLQSYTATTSTTLNGTSYRAVTASAGAESISFGGQVILAASPSLQTPGGAGDGISFGGALDDDSGGASHSITMIAGASGTIAFNGPIGANASLDDPTDIIVSSAASVNFVASATILGNLSLSSVSGTATISDNLSASTLTVAGTVNNLAMIGASTAITNQVTFNNTGNLQIGDAETDSFTFTGGISGGSGGTFCSSMSIAGSFSTTDNPLNFSSSGAVTILGNTSLQTGTGSITFNGAVDNAVGPALPFFLALDLSGDVRFNAAVAGTTPLDHVRFVGTGSPGLTTPAAAPATVNLSNVDVYLDITGALTLKAPVAVRRLVLYRGTLNLNATVLNASHPGLASLSTVRGAATQPWWGDFVAFGAAAGHPYNTNDVDQTGAPVAFAYPGAQAGNLRYLPAGGTYNNANGLFSTAPSGAIAPLGLNTATLAVEGNFYLNGVDLSATANWNLKIPNSSSTAGLMANGIGDGSNTGLYAVAYNAAVAFGQVQPISGVASAGNLAVVAAAGPAASHTNNNVTNGGNNDTPDGLNGDFTGWNFNSLQIAKATSVYDNLIKIEFNQAVENSNAEIYAAVTHASNGFFRFNGGSIRFTKAYRYTTPGSSGSPTAWDTNGNGYVDDGELTEITATTGLGDVLGAAWDPLFILVTFADSAPAGTSGSWNTDATGSSAGAGIQSTNRHGTHMTSTTDLTLLKGLLMAAWGKNHSSNYGDNSKPAYTATLDGCGPILLGAWLGRAPYNMDGFALPLTPSSLRPYDGHNFIHVRYSEPLDLSAVQGGNIGDSALGGVDVNASTMGNYQRSSAAFAALPDSATAAVMTMSNFLSWPSGSYAQGARVSSAIAADTGNTAKINLIARNDSSNPAGSYGLTVFVGGYSFVSGSERYWPGYLFNPASIDTSISVPAGQAITVLPSPSFKDRGIGTQVEPSAGQASHSYTLGGAITVYSGLSFSTDIAAAGFAVTAAAGDLGFDNGWDVDPPYVAKLSPTSQKSEIVSTLDTSGTFVNRFEIHVLDNMSLNNGNPGWDTKTPSTTEPFNHATNPTAASNNPNTGHTPDGYANPSTFPTNARIVGGVRDTSLAYPEAGETSPYDKEAKAFAFESMGIDTPTNAFSATIGTGVNNRQFKRQLPYLVPFGDDPFITLGITQNVYWGSLTNMYMTYDETKGFLTDHAGNLMRTRPERMEAIERTPPYVELALAVVGTSKVYIQFSEPVYHDIDSSQEIQVGDLFLSGANAPAITGMQVIERDATRDNINVMKVYLTLDKAITADMVLELKINPSVNPADSAKSFFYDDSQNNMLVGKTHRLSDIGLGVAEPVYAVDDILNPNIAERVQPIHDFTGAAFLPGRGTINIQARNNALDDANKSLPFKMYYDVDVPTQYLYKDQFWFPVSIAGLSSQAKAVNPDLEARMVLGSTPVNGLTMFKFTAADSELKNNAVMQFVMQLGSLPVATVKDITDPTSLIPWKIGIGGITEQRASVTILNNVIDVGNGEKTVLTYKLDKPGFVTITVFTLDNDVVRVLSRGQQAVGSYMLTWDGTNMGGQTVARGMYIIRVSGPGVDEMRKVMVVK